MPSQEGFQAKTGTGWCLFDNRAHQCRYAKYHTIDHKNLLLVMYQDKRIVSIWTGSDLGQQPTDFQKREHQVVASIGLRILSKDRTLEKANPSAFKLFLARRGGGSDTGGRGR